ncbi:hypothetical protein QG37_08208 [Candidozyma auris]|nr:hypothetical protein QG37_08208 [[Candida] auris]
MIYHKYNNGDGVLSLFNGDWGYAARIDRVFECLQVELRDKLCEVEPQPYCLAHSM